MIQVQQVEPELVLRIQVLEHVTEPSRACQELFRILKLERRRPPTRGGRAPTMTPRLERWKLRLADRARHSPLLWELSGWWLTLRSTWVTPIGQKLEYLAAAYRRARSRVLRSWLESHLRPWLEGPDVAAWREQRPGWSRYAPQLEQPPLTKSLILKAPGAGGEKGVLYVSFEYNWLRLLTHHDLPAILREYLLVGASSWSPPDYVAHWALARLGPDPIFIQVSNLADVALYRRFQHGLRPLPLLASDWICPEFYQPRPAGKRPIDLLMVAGWSAAKRHWLLFDALRRMPQHLRVVLIGQDGDGRTADDVWREARLFGVDQRIEIVRDAPIASVTDYQCQSKASVVLSAREGSCVVVAESLFADTPVVMMRDAHVGSRAYLNDQTGRLASPATLAATLTGLVEAAGTLAPRAWAVDHITCHQATSTLNRILRDYVQASGQPWTRDLVPMCWRPDPTYVRPEDTGALQPAYDQLRQQQGLLIAGHGAGQALSSPAPASGRTRR